MRRLLAIGFLLSAASTVFAASGADVAVTSVKVSRVGSLGRALVVRWRASRSVEAGFLVTVRRGPVLWDAASADGSGHAKLKLPEGLAGGEYEVRVLPHAVRCTVSSPARIVLRGPEKASVQALGYGTFVDRDGVPHRWYVNRSGTLIWDGRPYIPAGAMFLSKFLMDFRADAPARNEAAFRDDVRRLGAMKEAGVTDIYLNPCVGWRDKPVWVWQRFCDLCEDMGIRYGLQVTREVDPLRFWDVAADAYTVTVNAGETAEAAILTDLLASIDDGHRVMYAAFDSTSGELVDRGDARVEAVANGISASASPKAEAGRKLVVRFIPEMTYIGGMHDYWRGVGESYKKELDSFFGALKLGPGFRLWIDPLDNEQSLQGYASRALPHSPQFEAALAKHLERKYGSVRKLSEAWAVKGLEDAGWPVFARLIPLGSATGAGTGWVLDEVSGRTYEVEVSRSALWSDVRWFRENSTAELNNMVAERIKSHHNAPVVLKHEGTDMFTNRRAHGGFDGLGAEAYGTDIEHIRDCSRAVHAQALECGRTMWELTTETGLVSDCVGYPDPLRMFNELSAMVHMGAKGTYCFLVKDAPGDPNADWYIFNLAEDPRQYWWLGAYTRALKTSSKLSEYSPEMMAGAPQEEFNRQILGLNVPDLGRALQSLEIGGATFAWNLSDVPVSLETRLSGGGLRRVDLLPRAARPAIIEGAGSPSLVGVEKANLIAARHEWTQLAARAREMGMPLEPLPGGDWRAAWTRVDALRGAVGDTFATRMREVKVDGDLAEWAGVPRVWVKANNGVAGSRYENARFHIGYDERFLYVAGEVEDKTISNANSLGKLWNGDAVEVFVDLRPDADPGSRAYHEGCMQFVCAPTSASGAPAMVVFGPGLPPETVPKHSSIAARVGATGWIFEAAISRDDLNGLDLRPGTQIGLDIQLDNSDGADRTWSKLWHGGEDNFQNRLGFGRLTLGWPRM